MPNYRAQPPQKSEKRQILIKKALELREKGFSYKQISAQLNKPINVVSNLIYLARCSTYKKEVFFSPLTRKKRAQIQSLLLENPLLSIKELSLLTNVSPKNIARAKKILDI